MAVFVLNILLKQWTNKQENPCIPAIVNIFENIYFLWDHSSISLTPFRNVILGFFPWGSLPPLYPTGGVFPENMPFCVKWAQSCRIFVCLKGRFYVDYTEKMSLLIQIQDREWEKHLFVFVFFFNSFVTQYRIISWLFACHL